MRTLKLVLKYLIAGIFAAGSVLSTTLLDLGTIQATVGRSVHIFYASNDRRPIAYCHWSQVPKPKNAAYKLAPFPPFQRNLTAEAEGSCGFTLGNVTEAHISSWKFLVIFHTSLVPDKSDLDVRGHLNLNVSEINLGGTIVVKILDFENSVILVDSSNRTHANASEFRLTCCVRGMHARMPLLPQFYLGDSRISPHDVSLETNNEYQRCIKWNPSPGLTWQDDRKIISCKLNSMNITSESKERLVDSIRLRILYGPRLVKDPGKKPVKVHYSSQEEIRVRFLSNTEPIATWSTVFEWEGYEQLTSLEPSQYMQELRKLEGNEMEAIISLKNLSREVPPDGSPLTVSLKLRNMFEDRKRVNFQIISSPEIPIVTAGPLEPNSHETRSGTPEMVGSTYWTENRDSVGFTHFPDVNTSSDSTALPDIGTSDTGKERNAGSSSAYFYVIFAGVVILILGIATVYNFSKRRRSRKDQFPHNYRKDIPRTTL